ncbi:MAG TPA: DoxX family protein [Woeseiaceae bacterium]|nr:DoxX family protein [Woeseiaceae bacterium]
MADYLEQRSRGVIAQWPIAALRIYAGLFFAYHGLSKLQRGNFADGMSGFLTSTLDASFSFYRPFLEHVVLPHKALFAGMVMWGESLAGVALVLGLATRYAALVAAFLAMNFWFAKGQALFGGQNHDVVWMIVMLVIAFIPAGRIAGLDARLADRLRFLR